MTEPERLTQKLLQSLGFIVKPFSQKDECDSFNVIYTQVPFLSMRLDFALIKAQIAIEVNGNYWHGEGRKLNAAQMKRKLDDVSKERQLTNAGWRLIQFPASDLQSHSIVKRLSERLFNSFDV